LLLENPERGFRVLPQESEEQHRVWRFAPWPEVPKGWMTLEFRLIYDGKLPAASRSETRNTDKDRIRRVLSKQLAELFNTHPSLRSWHIKDVRLRDFPPDVQERLSLWMDPNAAYSVIEMLSHKYERCGMRFVPLVDNRHAMACSLNILFLRRDQPGNLIVSGGDLDNRLKVLLDALRLPQNCDEVLPPLQDDPLYVLMEDDRLVVDLRVTTDRLLTPPLDGEHLNDVRLIIRVKTVVTDTTRWGGFIFG
jgi:hypothetical protein